MPRFFAKHLLRSIYSTKERRVLLESDSSNHTNSNSTNRMCGLEQLGLHDRGLLAPWQGAFEQFNFDTQGGARRLVCPGLICGSLSG